ncbi:protein kinase domain-containing protein [Nonomuraea sp. NPDC003754]
MQVPGYTEIRELGHGGTGRVMLALRDTDRLPVAIKHLSDPELVDRFRTEAALVAGLDNPHIARLLEYVEGDRGAAIVMELVDGVTLRRLLTREGATGPEAAMTVLKGALLGLAEAHRAGVVHRDFKPENVIVTSDGDSRLVDFGLAGACGQSGPPAGTPPYMAPEQWNEAPASPATDVYAATVVFYECLTGRRPFDGPTTAALAYQHQYLTPPLRDVAEPVRALVGHGLAKDPAARPASAEAFIAELEATAAAAYGEDWERRGRTGLAALTVPCTTLFPLAGPTIAETTSTLARTTLAPAGKLAVTAAVTVATIAAVLATFTIWRDPPAEPLSGRRPTTGPAALPAPASGTAAPAVPDPDTRPGRPGEPEWPAEPRPADTAHRQPPGVTDPPPARPSPPPATPGRRPTRTPDPGPTRTSDPGPTRTRAPEPSRIPAPEPTRTRTAAPEPTRARTTPPADPATSAPADPGPGQQGSGDPGPGDQGSGDPNPGDPGTGGPNPGDSGSGGSGSGDTGSGDSGSGDTGSRDTGSGGQATTPAGRPIVSAEVSVSVEVPLLGGEGDGLVNAGLGVTVGSGLLGGAAFPGVLLLGRRMAVTRRRRRLAPSSGAAADRGRAGGAAREQPWP